MKGGSNKTKQSHVINKSENAEKIVKYSVAVGIDVNDRSNRKCSMTVDH